MGLSEELREGVGPLWEKMVTHPFVIELGDGTLLEEKFRTYFQQDYLFLKDWVMLHCMGIAKSPDFDAARKICAFLSGGLSGEEGLFRQAFRDMGISPDQVGKWQPLPTTLAYSGYLRTIAHEGSFLEIIIALLAIEWPYLDWAERLANAGKRPSNRYYQAWIDIHISEEMRQFVAFLRDTLDTSLHSDNDRLQEIFRNGLRYEYLFWEMSYQGEAWPG